MTMVYVIPNLRTFNKLNPGKANDEGGSSSFGYTNLIFNASFSNATSDHLGHNVYTNSGEVRSANVRLNFIIKT